MATKTIGLVAFRRDEAASVLQSLGLHRNSRGTMEDSSGKQVQCECCTRVISEKNFGGIMHGSVLFYCDNPACLLHYVHSKVRAGA